MISSRINLDQENGTMKALFSFQCYFLGFTEQSHVEAGSLVIEF